MRSTLVATCVAHTCKWVEHALAGNTVVDIGTNLSKVDKAALNKAVKAGQLVRWREPWMGYMGPERFHWAANNQIPHTETEYQAFARRWEM